MELKDLTDLITNAGFPVVVTAYLLIRLEKQLGALTTSITKLNTIIAAKLGIVISTEDNES